jgi:hypothetical protein
MTSLLELFDAHNCDKGSRRHRYDRAYEPLFEPLREQPITLLEVGVYTGSSLAVWADYFPNAQIIGVDTFSRIPRWKLPVMGHPRVKGYKCDSTKETPPEVTPGSVDIIIDDGSHEPPDQLATFLGYFPLLKSGGMYFVEDAIIGMNGFGKLRAGLAPHDPKYHDLRPGYTDGTAVIEIRHG